MRITIKESEYIRGRRPESEQRPKAHHNQLKYMYLSEGKNPILQKETAQLQELVKRLRYWNENKDWLYE